MVMKTISQRTIVRMMEALTQLSSVPSYLQARELYESEFPDWFVTHAEDHYEFNWDNILRDLRNRRFFYPGYSDFSDNITGVYLNDEKAEVYGEGLLECLAAFIASRQTGSAVLRSLQLDGFQVNKEQLCLVPLEAGVSEQEEEDRLTTLVGGSGLPSGSTILKHVNDAHSLFLDGKDHPSLGESRSFLQALIDDVCTETHKAAAHSVGLPGGTGPRIEYLKNVGFLTADEDTAYRAAWGALSAGTHPGVPAREEARIGLILALEFGQLLLLKFANWKANQYRRFA
jgi:hypothetical protein